jgi:hypothetical protein
MTIVTIPVTMPDKVTCDENAVFSGLFGGPVTIVTILYPSEGPEVR